ncbi:MAG: DUF2934 domain-containing protein [Nitrosomonadales bacterium]|nr:MAG: DUF2934 domain-containing protein [Nitrosomonadales bacterium]
MAEAKTKSAPAKAAPSAKKAPAAKKPAVTAKAAAKKPAAKKPGAPKAAAKKSAVAGKWTPGPQERYNMVQVAAYYIAERNGFNGNPLEFWTAAEAQVVKMLSGK